MPIEFLCLAPPGNIIHSKVPVLSQANSRSALQTIHLGRKIGDWVTGFQKTYLNQNTTRVRQDTNEIIIQ